MLAVLPPSAPGETGHSLPRSAPPAWRRSRGPERVEWRPERQVTGAAAGMDGPPLRLWSPPAPMAPPAWASRRTPLPSVYRLSAGGRNPARPNRRGRDSSRPSVCQGKIETSCFQQSRTFRFVADGRSP